MVPTKTGEDPATRTPSSPVFDLVSPDRPFDDILNFRDVGRSINEIHGSKLIKEGILFRSARPDDASERDKQRLVEEIGISTIIDLRSNTEHVMATRKRRAAVALDTPEPPVMPDADEHLLNLPNVQRHMISLVGPAFERMLLWRLDWYNFIKVLGLLASGYRKEAVRIIGEQVMKPRGLIGLAQDTLDCSAAEMREVFDVLAEDASYPVVIHCTQGKDRTGLVVMMLLFLLTTTTAVVVVEPATIAADYVRSEAELWPEQDERMQEILAIGLDEEYAQCPPGFTDAVHTFLDTKYRGTEAYLLSIGLSREKIDRIRNRLLLL